MQVAAIEFARNVMGLDDADTAEFAGDCKNPVVLKIDHILRHDSKNADTTGAEDLGGTLRVGASTVNLCEKSKISGLYGCLDITERHRHRYTLNPGYINAMEENGLHVSGYCQDTKTVESLEVPDHPWFLAVQYHPEFSSNPIDSHPLFDDFVKNVVHLSSRNKERIQS